MNDFDYEVKMKKDIARSAAHKINGENPENVRCRLTT